MQTFLGCCICGVCAVIYGWQFVRRKWTPVRLFKKLMKKGSCWSKSKIEPSDMGSRPVTSTGARTEIDALADNVKFETVEKEGIATVEESMTTTPFLRCECGHCKLEEDVWAASPRPGNASRPSTAQLSKRAACAQPARYWAREHNFVLDPKDVVFPPTAPGVKEYTPVEQRTGALFGLLSLCGMQTFNIRLIASVTWSTIGWSLLAGAMSNWYAACPVSLRCLTTLPHCAASLRCLTALPHYAAPLFCFATLPYCAALLRYLTACISKRCQVELPNCVIRGNVRLCFS